jgi:hypothetical protein
MHKMLRCTGQGEDIPGTSCSGYKCKIWKSSSDHEGLYDIVCLSESVEDSVADLFASATICPTASEIKEIKECSDVACGGYCSATRKLPDGSSNYVIENCLVGGNKYNVYLRLCNGFDSPTLSPTLSPTSPTKAPTPSPTTLLPSRTPTAPTARPTDQWRLSGCIERETDIKTPTIKNISTSSAIDDATVECMAACQGLDICGYWTLDVQNQICELKETNLEKHPSLTSISGAKFCVGFGK